MVEPSPSSLNGRGGCGLGSTSLKAGIELSAAAAEFVRRRRRARSSKFGVLLRVRALPDELEGREDGYGRR